jgi:hypothetical protein
VRIDKESSRVVVRTHAEGMFAKLAKDLEIAFPVEEASIEGTKEDGKSELRFRLDAAKVLGIVKDGVLDASGLSQGDRSDVLDKMRDAFDAKRNGEIKVTTVVKDGRADITVAAPGGHANEGSRLDVIEEEGGLRVRGTVEISMSRLGLKPVKGPLGAFRLKDRVSVRFDLRLLTALAVLAFGIAGCGKAPTISPEVVDLNPSDAGLTAAQTGATSPTPKKTQKACPAAPKEARTGTPPGSTCTVDADCAEGRDGRCRTVYLGHGQHKNACTYDACGSDADCSGANDLCVCGASQTARNVCRPANCHGDADCAGGTCKTTPPGPSDDIYVPAGPFCTSAKDACKDDASCGGGGKVCAYDRGQKLWACRPARMIPPG